METTTPTPEAVPVSPADLFREAARRALQVPTPVDRARQISDLLKAVADEQGDLTEVRRADLTELRPTNTLAQLSALTGLSIPRVDQILKGK